MRGSVSTRRRPRRGRWAPSRRRRRRPLRSTPRRACGPGPTGCARWPGRHTTLHGKLRVWRRELDRAALKGDEQLLDLGCGRGAVLIEAAGRLPTGRAVGVDLWSGKDQSRNRPEVTLANAAAAGVSDRVDVQTADMTELPFADGSFDVVTSALAIHNIPSRERRCRAVDEAMRVLRPGGRLIVADFWPMARQYADHIGQGTLRELGPEYWYGGPWLGVTLLHAVKES
ncbi:class I SAM-dependent methyltransferase [Streptomyces sp. NBC_01378]|uniref:class I SAM-dependent methyltransferase n=1 Tax=Streptomyces sp. NBC_01378 TaxID=2903844 RepID=UPI00324FAB8B